MQRSIKSVLIGLVLLLSWTGSGPVLGDWPNFRGPGHDGISDETGFQKSWTQPIPQVWERDIGSGFSSFACVGDRVYTCGTKEKNQVIFCLNADTGEVIWQKPIGPAYSETAGGDGPRATPTVDQDRVYILGAQGNLLCLDSANGSEIWRTSFKHMPQWDYSGSVLIEGNLAIAAAGKGDGSLVAFDKKTGKLAWKCGDDQVGYATPYPFTFEGKRYIVGFTGVSAMIAEATSGRLVWRTAWKTDWDVNSASPIFHDGHLFLSSGYKTGCGLFKIRAKGDDLELDQIWKSKVLLNKFQSCILHQGKLYTSDQKDVSCVDFMTGKEEWRRRRSPHGTLILADDHLLLLTEEGRLEIAKVSSEGFNQSTSAEILSGRCWTVPVLHRGKLYARNLTHMACFNLRP